MNKEIHILETQVHDTVYQRLHTCMCQWQGTHRIQHKHRT